MLCSRDIQSTLLLVEIVLGASENAQMIYTTIS